MPLTYPLAESARRALDAASMARTVGEARDLAGAAVSLVSEWLRPTAGERQTLQDKIDAGVAAGFIQVYEDNQGQPVFAVAFWKRGAAPPAPPRQRAPAYEVSPQPRAAGDTVDDLYFERGRSSRRARRKLRGGDPNQLDLFAAPEPSGPKRAASGDPLAAAGASGDGAPVGAGPPTPKKPKTASKRQRETP